MIYFGTILCEKFIYGDDMLLFAINHLNYIE